MFEVNETYTNRNGNYTVLSISGRKMQVRYEDGSVGSLNVGIQERIWENILAERETAAKKKKRSTKTGVMNRHFIKTLSVAEETDLSIPGLRQRIAATPTSIELNPGDRLIYCAAEPLLFFAVVTVTTRPKTVKAKEFMFGGRPGEKIYLYPIDVDAHIMTLESAIPVDSTELESLPNHKEALSDIDQFLPINEDDFELLAELITEVDADTEEANEDAEEVEEADSIEDIVDLSG